MSHDRYCPDPWEARRQADRDARSDFGYGRIYRSPYDCDESNDVYRREYSRQFEQMEERRALRRREAQREQEEQERLWWEEQLRHDAELEALMHAEAEYLASLQPPDEPEPPSHTEAQ